MKITIKRYIKYQIQYTTLNHFSLLCYSPTNYLRSSHTAFWSAGGLTWPSSDWLDSTCIRVCFTGHHRKHRVELQMYSNRV